MSNRKRYTITDILQYGATVDLTCYRTSIINAVENVEYIVSNIYDDYIEEIMYMSKTVVLSDSEFDLYRFRPKLLSHKLYKTPEFDFLICKINNIVSHKDFDFKEVLVIPPSMIIELSRIYEKERKYIRTNTHTNVLALDEFYYSEQGYKADKLVRVTNTNNNNNTGSGSGGTTGGGNNTGGGMSPGDIEKYNELVQRINQLEEDIVNIDKRIADILAKLLDEDLNDIITEIIDTKIKEQLEYILSKIKELEEKVPDLLDDKFKDMNKEISDIKDRLSKLEEGDLSGAGIKTRDVVFDMDIKGRDVLGLDLDTEIRIPYKGTIVSSNISVNVSSKKISNILIVLQMYDDADGFWYDRGLFDLQADRYHQVFPVNRKINNTAIRLYIKSGDITKVDKMNIILSIIEDEEEKIKE